MKYIALDLETCGLDTDKDSVLQIVAIFDDLSNPLDLQDLPKFEVFIDDGFIHGNAYAINMHIKSGLWQRWLNSPKVAFEKAISDLCRFIGTVSSSKERINLAGKNIGKFDFHCLRRSPHFFNYVNNNCSHRFIDPSENFFDYNRDVHKPDLKECKRRAGLEDIGMAHDAMVDCLDIVRLIRYVSNSKKTIL